MLEQLITAADEAILRSLDIDSPEWEKYFNVTQ
jgi:hypothetical protein